MYLPIPCFHTFAAYYTLNGFHTSLSIDCTANSINSYKLYFLYTNYTLLGPCSLLMYPIPNPLIHHSASERSVPRISYPLNRCFESLKETRELALNMKFLRNHIFPFMSMHVISLNIIPNLFSISYQWFYTPSLWFDHLMFF